MKPQFVSMPLRQLTKITAEMLTNARELKFTSHLARGVLQTNSCSRVPEPSVAATCVLVAEPVLLGLVFIARRFSETPTYSFFRPCRTDLPLRSWKRRHKVCPLSPRNLWPDHGQRPRRNPSRGTDCPRASHTRSATASRVRTGWKSLRPHQVCVINSQSRLLPTSAWAQLCSNCS